MNKLDSTPIAASKFKAACMCMLALIIFLSNQLVGAEEPMRGTREHEKPPKEKVSIVDLRKLSVAKELTSWTKDTLSSQSALVAVVARKGGKDVIEHGDRTGMAHSGLAIYDPRAQTWILYNLVNVSQGRDPEFTIYRTALLDFFYGQTGYEREALILIPDETTQERVYEGIVSGKYKSLTFTDSYNLLSPPSGRTSFNCNKWILMNIAAARIDDYNPEAVLLSIEKGFEPGYVHLSPIERMFVGTKNNIRADELPSGGNIPTVTVESFYDSELFSEKITYSGREF